LNPSTSSSLSSPFALEKSFQGFKFKSYIKFKRAYYLLARKYHPDKYNGEISKISKVECVERFKIISNAFEYLKLANWLA